MACHLHAQVLGGQVKTELQADTVGELMDKMDLAGQYAATINGRPGDRDTRLTDYNFVTFAPAVKGGA